MDIKLFALVILWTYGVLANRSNYPCNRRSTVLLLKRPAYDFSVKMLQRVNQETDSHFVYSPMSTWLQLSALAEGADGRTVKEIRTVTRQFKKKCYKNQLGDILNKLDKDLSYFEYRRKGVIAINKLMGVKKSYVQQVEKLFGIKPLLLDFNEPMKSAKEMNQVTKDGTDGVVDRIVYYDDFMSAVLLLSDANYFKSDWKFPFNSNVEVQPFYSRVGEKIGAVSMMNLVEYFNIADLPHIGATVLEIPCASRRVTMLVFLPRGEGWVSDVFYKLQKTTLSSIFNVYKSSGPKIVNVTMPRFKQRTELENLPELIFDMGIRRLFDPDKAEFKGISKYDMHISLMTQISKIEVNERGVAASASSLIRNDTAIEFLVNKPFAYMLVDKTTEFILFAGVYSVPSVV